MATVRVVEFKVINTYRIATDAETNSEAVRAIRQAIEQDGISGVCHQSEFEAWDYSGLKVVDTYTEWWR